MAKKVFLRNLEEKLKTRSYVEPPESVDNFMEETLQDIANNLSEWANDVQSIYYRTKEHWYIMTPFRNNKSMIQVVRLKNDCHDRECIGVEVNTKLCVPVGRKFITNRQNLFLRLA